MHAHATITEPSCDAESGVMTSNNQEVEIEGGSNTTKIDVCAKRKIQAVRLCNKKLKFGGVKNSGGHILLSRSDFSSDESWNKFVCYQEQVNSRASMDTGNSKRVAKVTKVKQLINKRTSILKVCRICLATDCRMHLISEHKLTEAYQLLTGLQVKENDRLPTMLCVECAHRVSNCNKFRDKCLRASKLMSELLTGRCSKLTSELIGNIDRHAHSLTSHLTSHVYDEKGVVEIKVENKYTALEDDDILINDVIVKDEDIDKQSNNEIGEYIEEVILLPKTDVDESHNKFDDFESVSNESDDPSTDFEVIDPNDCSTNNLKIEAKTDMANTKGTNKKGVTNFKTNNKVVQTANRKGAVDRTGAKAAVDRTCAKGAVGRTGAKGAVGRIGAKSAVDKASDKGAVEKTGAKSADAFDGKFTIKMLSHEEQIAEVLKRRDSDNYKKSNYKCDKCFRGFLGKNTFEKHLLRHTDVSGTSECPVCFLRFESPGYLSLHLVRHKLLYSCNLCDFVTNSSRSTAVNHYRWHKGVQYECPHCEEVFKHTTTYCNHLRIKHPSDFICQLCGYSFVSQKGVLAHQKLSHELDGTKQEIPADGPSCDTCNIRFASAEAFDTHLKISARHSTKEQGPGDSMAPRNEYSYNLDGVTRKRRVRSKTATKKGEPITCEQCGEVLATGRAYYFHFKVHHPGKNRTRFRREPIMCEVCGRAFRCASLLTDHMLVHTDAKFSCEVCGKVLASRLGLRLHEATHEPASRVRCAICGKYFSNACNMKRHKLTHTGVKPYKCDMCQKSFFSKHEMNQHQEHIHLKKPWPKKQRGKTGTRRRTRQDDDLEDT